MQSFSCLKSLVVGVAILATLGLTTACQYRSRTPEASAEHVVKKLNSKLSLDEKQQKIVKDTSEIIVAFAKEMKAQRVQHINFAMEQIKAPELDKAKILAQINEWNLKKDALVTVVLNNLSELHKTLSPQQRTIIIEELTKLQNRLTKD